MPPATLELEFGPEFEFNDDLFQNRDLVDTLARVIQERTNRMICDLRVDVSRSEVVIWGRTRAYYYKQLASQAVLAEVTGLLVINEIQVL